MGMKVSVVLATAVLTAGLVANDASAELRRPGPPPGREMWVQLGCQSVGFGIDHDVIRVGRREGRFKAIRLQVTGNRIHMLDLKVVYANGEPDDIPVRVEMRPGPPTRPFDLRGFERAIERIEMTYMTVPNFRGRANVCVDGLT
jgi:hypothetical protein